MAGVNIYLTEKEQTMLIEYVTNGVSILGEAEGTWEQVQEDMENGLGKALYKLYKGRVGARHYKKYVK